jgi:carboxylesterase type B
MSSYWVNFITKGDPNGYGLPNWPQYRDINSKVMVLGDTVQAEAAPPVDKLKFYAAAYQRCSVSGRTEARSYARYSP